MKQETSEKNIEGQTIKNTERSSQAHARDDERKRGQARAPIGVFDSGVGGLTIISALRKELPQEDFIYIGDTFHCPYGARSDAEIIDLTLQANRFLIEQGVKLIVIACNTASQAALNALRITFDIPFVGVVPAVKPAARATRRGRIGVAATNQAAKAAYLHQLIDDFAEGIEVYAVGCPELVTLVEQGELDGQHVEESLRHALQPLLSKEIDVLVLGCTHFPALRPTIERVVGNNIQVIDSGNAIARRTHAVLEAEGLTHPYQEERDRGELSLFCSGDAQTFSEVASKILGYPVIAQHIEL
ncbi:MAG TPA: glutamate racemase [Ktedonobacteraceae bacterium]|jgi:glutamate racemase|nr:glutamate racemase [Ktedonobacteraceae bacterium]